MKSFTALLFVLSLPVLLAAQIWTAQNTNYPQPLFGFDVEAVNTNAAWAVGVTGDFTVSPWSFGDNGNYFSHFPAR